MTTKTCLSSGALPDISFFGGGIAKLHQKRKGWGVTEKSKQKNNNDKKCVTNKGVAQGDLNNKEN